jgi:[ribosomal protein S5]-alanine N-acetyltransferase
LGHIYLETERFYIRQWHINDIKELHEIMSDSRVHTYASSKPWTVEYTARYINFMLDKNFKTLELFHGACVLKGCNIIIGLTGLNPYLSKKPEIEWKFGVPFWGKGYATEIGNAIIREAFKSTDIELIYGMAHPQNRASIRVMEKIGMKCIGLQDFRGSQDMFYQIKRQ